MKVNDHFTHQRLGECVVKEIRKDGTILVGTAEVIGKSNNFILSKPTNDHPRTWDYAGAIK